jgi:hypothetical protein
MVAHQFQGNELESVPCKKNTRARLRANLRLAQAAPGQCSCFAEHHVSMAFPTSTPTIAAFVTNGASKRVTGQQRLITERISQPSLPCSGGTGRAAFNLASSFSDGRIRTWCGSMRQPKSGCLSNGDRRVSVVKLRLAVWGAAPDERARLD